MSSSVVARLWSCVAVAVFAVGCRNLEVPPSPGPGSLQGRVVYAVPGRLEQVAAVGAQVTVLGTGASTLTQEEGRFFLPGILQAKGSLLITLDLDGDGQADRQRLLDLSALGAGFGRDVLLGDVVLSRNAEVHGVVRLQGRGASGLSGITVFVPGAPWSTYTADDGSYRLPGLPEGPVEIAFFEHGFEPESRTTALEPGDEKALPTVHLAATTDGPATVRGRLVTTNDAPASDVRARFRTLGVESPLSVAADGTFERTALTSGVYAFAFEREGSLTIALYNVLLPPGTTDLGTMTLLEGTSRPASLTGPDVFVAPDGGVVDAGVELPDAGADDAGLTDAGTPDAGTPDAGSTDAGTPDAGSVDAGSPDAGGPLPIAVATGPAVAAPGSQVTLSGMSSTGDFPLVYRWRQVGGTAVTLNLNDSALAHSPRFTAPAAGTVVEFELTVEDRVGALSLPARVRVGIGVQPVARFSPDGGLVGSAQVVTLTSTSYDDASVALVGYAWALATGSPGTLISDGGSTAQWQAPVVAANAPDQLGGVTLTVTNAVGARSNAFTQYYTVRAINPNNWTLDAGPPQNVAVGAIPPQVQLSASVSAPLVPSPQYTVSWSCPPSIALIAGDTLTPRFVAPVIAGPTRTVTCQLTATGQPPLDPPTLSGTVNVFLRDAAPPTVVSSNVEATRLSRFGFFITASEGLSSALTSTSPNQAYGVGVRIIGRSLAAGTQYGVYSEGATYTSFEVDLSDLASPVNTSTNLSFGPAATIPVQTVWTGPYESVTSFDDPRPVVATLSQMHRDVQELNGVTPGAPTGFELVATQPGALVRFAGLDLSQRPTCDPTACPLTSTSQALDLTPGAAPASADRTSFGGAELIVATSTDGGLAPLAARRGATGTWSAWPGLVGAPGVWGTTLRAARFDTASGQLFIDTWSPSTGAFTPVDLVATGLTSVALVAHADEYVAMAVGPTRQLLVRKRNPADLTWSTVTTGTALTDVLALRLVPMSSGVVLVGVETPTGLVLQRLDSGGRQTVSSAPVSGWAAASWGGSVYVAYGLNGDVRLRTIAPSVWSGAGGGAVDFGGPPRTGFSAPYPVMLDANPLCEASAPHLDFVEEALVVTWQERCAPATQWKVMVRVVR